MCKEVRVELGRHKTAFIRSVACCLVEHHEELLSVFPNDLCVAPSPYVRPPACETHRAANQHVGPPAPLPALRA
eukprot:scaffold145000_cov18-Tisochrysis_lutea.AAC.1